MSVDKARILVVDDEPKMCEFLEFVLSEEGYAVDSSTSGEDALSRIGDGEYDIVITDLMMPGVDGMRLLEEAKRTCPDTAVIMITGYSTVENAVEAMKRGAYDYLPKPFKIDEIKVVVARAAEQLRIISENRRLKRELARPGAGFCGIIGKSKPMQAIFELIERVAATDSTVLIRGESGTGKELVARAIHRLSKRNAAPFVSINCAALPETLLESELFGHSRGAFTGAISAKRGLFEEADGGTVFLDEIGDVPLALQAKLLRFLQNREFLRIGETAPRKVDVRIIVATNRDLERAIVEGEFRQDLYYRLNVISLSLPPLRERREDIPLLVTHFLKKFGEERERKDLGVDPAAMAALMSYDWPGNVRELENAIERAVILCRGNLIGPADLPPEIAGIGGPGGLSGVLRSAGAQGTPARMDFREAVEEFERNLILEAMRESGWVQARAASILGLKRSTLNEMIKRLGLSEKLDRRIRENEQGKLQDSGG